MPSGAPGHLEAAEIDTAHFKGNFPESCEVHGVVSSKVSILKLSLMHAAHKVLSLSLTNQRNNGTSSWHECSLVLIDSISSSYLRKVQNYILT